MPYIQGTYFESNPYQNEDDLPHKGDKEAPCQNLQYCFIISSTFPAGNAQPFSLSHILYINPCTRKMVPVHIAMQTVHVTSYRVFLTIWPSTGTKNVISWIIFWFYNMDWETKHFITMMVSFRIHFSEPKHSSALAGKRRGHSLRIEVQLQI